MVWAIIKIYTSKCAQMDPQQLLKTSKFYSKRKKCDIEKTLGGWVPPPLGSPKVKRKIQLQKLRQFYPTSFLVVSVLKHFEYRLYFRISEGLLIRLPHRNAS